MTEREKEKRGFQMQINKKKMRTLFISITLITAILMSGKIIVFTSSVTQPLYLHGPPLQPIHMHSNITLNPIHMHYTKGIL